ncbi:MAG: hypothetical protein LBE02_07440 [Spirochaetaceae bacterium]|jgi:hypothetical protein|nr:hypothetical protein [Spirochaetaceae bacterium]
MKFLSGALLALIVFAACAHSEGDSAPPRLTERPPQRVYRYYLDVSSDIVGFNLLVNGTELLVVEGKNHSSRVDINDWMVSGDNELVISITWPEGVKFAPGTSSASFKLFANDTLLREYRWPAAGAADAAASYPYTISETFKPVAFPRILVEKAEKVISSAGTLSQADQEEIAALAEDLRRAFTGKNLAEINSLFGIKYADLAAARFTTTTAIRTETAALYGELMEKEAYTVRPFYGRYGYFSTADDRLVKVVQGRIGFPEPALVITYREGRRTLRYDLDLYFAKIDGRWVILR